LTFLGTRDDGEEVVFAIAIGFEFEFEFEFDIAVDNFEKLSKFFRTEVVFISETSEILNSSLAGFFIQTFTKASIFLQFTDSGRRLADEGESGLRKDKFLEHDGI